jgi:uncharacterized RDD family membrane protein YckC
MNTEKIQYASMPLRTLAFIIDVVIVISICLLIISSSVSSYWNEFLILTYKNSQPYSFFILFSPTIYIIIIIFFMAFIPFPDSPGKLLCGIRIVDIDYNKIRYLKSFFRTLTKFFFLLIGFLLSDYYEYKNHLPGPLRLQTSEILALVSNFLFFLSNFVAVFNKQKRTLHDHICGTYVIKKYKKGKHQAA